jgi:WD40 repeat protein
LDAEVALDGEITAMSLDAALGMGVAATTAGTIWYVNLQEESKIRLVNSHTNQITDLAFSEDEAYLTSTSTDGTVRIWSVAGREQVMQFKLVRCLFYAGVGSFCVCVLDALFV